MFLCFKLSFNYDLLYHVVHRQTFCVYFYIKWRALCTCKQCYIILFHVMLCNMSAVLCTFILLWGYNSCHVSLSHARLCDDNSITKIFILNFSA